MSTEPDGKATPGDAKPETAEDVNAEVFISGLRNPPAAVRGMGMAALLLEAVVLLLALQPVRQFSPWSDAVALSITGALVVLCLGATGFLRKNWGWKFGIAVQVAVIAGGVAHWSLAVLGVLFLAVWLYVLKVRRTVMGSGATSP